MSLSTLTYNYCYCDDADGSHCKTLIGAVDYSWLFTYALFMIIRLDLKVIYEGQLPCTLSVFL